MRTILHKTLKFMLIILVLCVVSLPFVVMFAFDAPGTTRQQVTLYLSQFYGLYVLLPWFVIALGRNVIKMKIKKE